MISVTNNILTLTIADGDSTTHFRKKKVTVFAYKNNVYMFWDGHIQIKENYANFSTPAGASAVAVASSINTFMNT